MHNKQVEFDTGGQLEAEAQRSAGLATRLERMLAISAMVEAKPGGWAWVMGRCVMLWAERIASLPGRDARREALQEVPPAQSHQVELEVRRLFAARAQEALE